MAKYSIKDIKELRELTGAGMMDVKNALEEANGDREEAIKIIRLAGQKSLAKREDRSTAAGLVVADVFDDGDKMVGVMVEVNSETDFVAKNEKFTDFADEVKKAAVKARTNDVDELLKTDVDGKTVQQLVDDIAALVGEKCEVKNVACVEGDHVEAYLHYSSQDLPPQVGVLIATDDAAKDIAHDVALHIAAYNPEYIDRDAVPEEVVAKERGILEEMTRKEGKPEKIVPKIVMGRLNAFYKQICLLDQEFAKDTSTTVGKLVKKTGGAIVDFKRFHVGA